MGNRVSYECDNNAPDRREDGEVSRDAQQNVDSSNMPRLRGGDTSAAMGDSTRYNGWYVDDSAGPSATDGYDPDCYEIPAPPNNLPRASSRSYKQNGPATSAPVPARGGFDFNDSAQPLPWNERIQRNEMNERSHRNERKERRRDDHGQVRRFTDCADRELLDYLAARSIAPEFLREIDLFLQGHPEIASCTEGRKMLDDLNTLSPLDAYVYFLKGYTKPARYIDGIVRTDYFQVPRSYAYILLRKKFDPELVAFFDGFDFRHDIIDRIDREVYMGIQDLDFGRKVSVSLRKLICYAVWGNPVDAYKYFEYSYQNEFMPHRYLPDHVVLGHVPKPADYAEPRPSDVGGGKKHTYVRLRMARAQDQGVDVLDVLLTEYKTALLRKGHRRVEIDRLCAAANNRLNVERRDSTGADIVDMIMDDATGRQPQPPCRRVTPRFTQSRAHTFSFRTTQTRFRGGKHRVIIRKGPGFLQIQSDELRQAKSNLELLYVQEKNSFHTQVAGGRVDMNAVRTRRATGERRYVNCLVRYLRAVNRMSSTEANELMGYFTRDRMAARMGMPNQYYLLGVYPYELK